MLINTIEHMSEGRSERKVWKLAEGNGRLQNVIALDADELDGEVFHELIAYTVIGRPSMQFDEAKISFSDQAGDQWSISRVGTGSRQVTRNAKPIESSRIEQSILGALLDLDAALSPQESLTGICQIRRMYFNDEGKIEVEDVRDSASRVRNSSRGIQQKIKELRQECYEIIPSLGVENAKQISILMQRLRPIYYSWNEINRQKKDIRVDDESQEKEILSPEQIDNFEKELAVLRDIEKASLSLLDPKESPVVIKQKLGIVEEKLRGLSREIEMGHTSLKLSARIHWTKVLECLARVEIYRGLVAASEKTLRDHDSFLVPAIRSHIQATREICERNTSITSELEACLASLSLYQKKIEERENAKATKRFSNLMRNFVNAEPLGTEPEADPNGIEQARLAVDHALCKMGEIKTEVEVAQNMLATSGDSLHSRHEKLVSKFSQLCNHWKEIAKKFMLPEDLKIAEAIKLMCSHGKMHDLLQLREGYRRSLSNRREKLLELRELIENWQYLIGSQKDIALENERILLAEASSLIQLRPRKERQFERFKRHTDRYKAMGYLVKQLTQRQMSLTDKWQRAFDAVNCRSHPIQDGNWLRVFERYDAIRALESILSDQTKRLQGSEILERDQNDYPINMYLIPPHSKNHLDFLNLFGQLDADNLIVVGCDNEFRDMLRKLGAGVFEPIIKKRKPKPKVESAEPAVTPEVVVSPRDDRRQNVDRVMEVFSSSRRGRSRTP